jgi:DNA modification methylase
LIKLVKEYKYDGIKQNISRRLTKLIKELPDNSVDLVITSPPYSTMKNILMMKVFLLMITLIGLYHIVLK